LIDNSVVCEKKSKITPTWLWNHHWRSRVGS